MAPLTRLFGALLLLVAISTVAAELPRRVVSIEGVTEYRLENGLKVVTIPDPGADTIGVHIVYLVGFKNRVATVFHWAVSFLGNSRAQRSGVLQQAEVRPLERGQGG